jgi:hypothetical protein
VAVEESVLHPADPMPLPVLAALGVGVALFVGCSALSLRIVGGPVLVGRLGAIVVMAAGLAVVLFASASPTMAFGVVAAVLVGIVLVEARITPGDVAPAAVEG